jgi:Ca-activated chloride channel family protein
MERWISFFAVALALSGCGGDETASRAGGGGVETTEIPGVDTPIPGSRAVTQGGAQDIALFREIVSRGEVPGPETLDDVGFFAEHAVDLPPADCGEDLCIHPSLAVAPRFNGDNWTMAFIAMNTPIDPSTLERPSAHVAVVVDVANLDAPTLDVLNTGVGQIAGALEADDRLSIIEYASRPRVLLENGDETAELPTLGAEPLGVAGDLYGALATAGRLVDGDPDGRVGRIILVSSGAATAGIDDDERIVTLAESYARAGVALNVIGFGDPTASEARLLSRLGDLGAGTYSLAEDDEDLAQILDNQSGITLFPIATDLTIAISPGEGYRVGRVWGARRAEVKEGMAFLDSPALFVGHRTGSSDTGSGRRGGGGGLFVELIAEDGALALGPELPAFSYEASWIANDGTLRNASSEVVNTLAPGQNPSEMWPEFVGGEKPFMMLNMYLALRTAVDFYAAGDCPRSRGVEEMMAPSVEVYQGRIYDEDIRTDWILLQDLTDNVTRSCGEAMGITDPEAQQSIEVIEPVDSGAGCFFS